MATLWTSGLAAQIPPPRPPVPSPPAPRPTAAGPRLPLSLADAVFIGLRDNRTVKSAYITRVAEKYDLYVAKGRFYPSALLGASAQASRDAGVTGVTTVLTPTATWLIPTGAQFQFSWSRFDFRGGGVNEGTDIATLSITQPLLRGAGIAVNTAPIKIAELQEKINRLTLKSTVSNTVTSVIVAYRSLLQAQQQLTIARQSLDRSNAQLATNQALIDAGRMAGAEIVQTRSDIANQQVALLAAEQQRNSAQLVLLGLLAMDLHTDVTAADPLEARHVSIDLDRAIAIALDNRPDYLSQKWALGQARQFLIVAKNDRLWTLSAVGSLQHQTERGGLVAVDPKTGLPVSGLNGFSESVGLELEIPLGDRSLAQAEVQATTSVRTQEIQLADLRAQIEAQVRDAVQGVELSWRQVDAARQARDLAAQTLELEREKLKAGRASNFEVLSFETGLRAADTQALSASILYLDALTTLDQQLGTTLDTWKISLND
ncbi:MAG: TolC family protein [Caulobacteraceae bacterium]